MRYVSGDYQSLVLDDARPQRFLAAASLAAVALLCAWTLCGNLAGSGSDRIDLANDGDSAVDVAARGDKLAVTTEQKTFSVFDAMLFEPHAVFGSSTRTFALAMPSWASAQFALAAPALPVAQVAQGALPAPHGDQLALNAPTPPLPQPRPHIQIASLTPTPRRVASAPPEKPSLFERLFGRPAQPTTLAYAAPDDSGLLAGGQGAGGLYDRSTAVYDISAHKVYMPDGTVLEAHSGLGSRLDDPNSADVRDRGVTPPTLYDLQPRESLFHGVQALRLIPVDDSKVFGRSGLLAHSYMLGPNGDSNGCVSFRDYDAFLRAYMNHEIKRLAVVARLS